MAAAKKGKKHDLREKKTFAVVYDRERAAMFKVIYKEGGLLPKSLSGAFNTQKAAWQAIGLHKTATYSYLDHVRDKENGESKDKNRE